MSLEEALKGKCVVVTGAGNGIGRAISQRLHSYGAKVYALSRSQAPLDTLVKECPAIVPIQLDIGLDWEKTRSVVQNIKDVDIVINNAAIVDLWKPVMEFSEQDYDKIMDVNVKALFNISQTAAKNMIEGNRKGTILNISSFAALRAVEGTAIYCASKAAVDMLTKSLALELGKHQIRANSINLGFVLTPASKRVFGSHSDDEVRIIMAPHFNKIPYNNNFLPIDEVVNTVLFVASDLSKSLTGSCISHDGGLTTS